MYVSPFWSYRETGRETLVVNEINGRRETLPERYLDALRRAYEDPTVALPDSVASAVDRLDIVFPDKQAAHQWVTSALAGARTEVPLVDQIELTNRCPYTCKMCPRTTSMQRSLGNMPLGLFESVTEQIAGFQDYTALHHFGESLMHPQLEKAVRIALRHGVRTGLSCNPPSLSHCRAERLLDAGIANLVLSLDSLDSDTYREIRGRAARLDLADRNIRELVHQRNTGGYSTWITLQMIAMRINQTQIDTFLAYCQEVGVDRGVVVRLGRWDFNDDYVATLGEHDSLGYTAPCQLPETSVVVLWDGRVVPCCHDYDGHVVLGDLRKQTLAEVWAAPAAKRFRWRNEDYALCQQCAFSRWFKERQRAKDGFLRFHRSREHEGSQRYEWTNPASLGKNDGRELFDRFDVYTREQR
jgi:radical SAM protein with 4Fe4S-binding SPASM domain